MVAGLLDPLKMANRYLKEARRRQLGKQPGPVRRIERVFPPPGRRMVAMTFDDGPTVSPARPGDGTGLTENLIRILSTYGARGTFNVIGSTASSYPDREGRRGTPLWSGVKFDHYPEFGQDNLAGVVNQKALARRLIDEGHELSNHGYQHVAFGPIRVVYGSRSFLPDSEAVYADLFRLHEYLRNELGYIMRLARPPHYIDNTTDGKSAYDVYARLGYNYLAASFDGGGWKPSCGNYRADVQAMVDAVEEALARDPDSLNGQIIFQKDGYNMSRESPVVDALPRQLEALRRYGYEVVTVSELLAVSPFVDLDPAAPYAGAVRALVATGHNLAWRDNSLRPSQTITREELARMLGMPPASPAERQPLTWAEMLRALPAGLERLPEDPAVVCAAARSRGLLAAIPFEVNPTAPVQRGWAAAVVAQLVVHDLRYRMSSGAPLPKVN